MRRILIIVVSLIFIFPMATAVGAVQNDTPWERLMRNKDDVIAVGQITQVVDNLCTIEVAHTIVSTLGENRQLRPESIVLCLGRNRGELSWDYVGNRNVQAQAGDCVIVAANQIKGSTRFSGYMYKTDSTDFQTLLIQTPRDASPAFLMEVAMIEDFIHSDGVYNTFEIQTTGDGAERVVRLSDGAIIYKSEIPVD